MGDARAVVQMRSGDKDDKKKAKGVDVEATALPDKALDSPGDAAGALGAEHLARLVATLQMAGGNTAVQSELAGLEQGRNAAVQGKTEKDAFEVMTEGQQIEYLANKRGGVLPEGSGKEAPPPGTPPPGMDSPQAVSAFLMQRAAQFQQLAGEYAAMQMKATEIAALAGLDAAAQAAFGQAAAYYGQTGADYQNATATYSLVAADMASNEFAGLATPPVTAGAMYQERLAILAEQKAALGAAAAALVEAASAVDAEIAANEAALADLDGRRAALDEQIANAGASEGGDGADGGGGGDGAAQLAEQSAQLSRRAEALRGARSVLEAKKATTSQLAASLAAKAAQLDMLANAYNILLGGAAATPTGRPTDGG